MSHHQNDKCNDSLENLQSDKDLNTEASKETQDLYKGVIKENTYSYKKEKELIDYLYDHDYRRTQNWTSQVR